MRNRILEVYCDLCGDTDHYLIGTPDSELRENNWIITADKREFCSKACYRAYKSKKITK